MNILRPGDEPMHYEDGSHRWIPPTAEMEQHAWEAAVRAHLLHHWEAFGGMPSGRLDRGAIQEDEDDEIEDYEPMDYEVGNYEVGDRASRT